MIHTLDTALLQVPGLLFAWIGFLGGCIGSFMNVVVYRMPARMSLIHPGSRCPLCGHAIRWYDNLPVIGWLGLRGKCRDCRAPIPVRYPVVEGLVALLFLAAWYQQMHPFMAVPTRPAMTLPSLPRPGSADAVYAESIVDNLLPGQRVRLIEQRLWQFGCSMSLSCVLLCVALIEFDGQRLPAALLVALASVPLTQRVASEMGYAANAANGWGWLWGMLTAVVVGGVARACGRLDPRTATQHAVLALVVVVLLGPTLGLVAIAVATGCALLALRLSPLWARTKRVLSWSGVLSLVAIAATFALRPQ